MPDAKALISHLNLEPHPEGGWFRQTFRDAPKGGRGYSTAIYYLLEDGDRSHWHKVDAAEVWHFYTGSPLQVSLSDDGITTKKQRLGPDVLGGDSPQVIVPAGHWQAAQSLGEWTLVGCTVAPGFEFEGFEMALPDWTPG